MATKFNGKLFINDEEMGKPLFDSAPAASPLIVPYGSFKFEMSAEDVRRLEAMRESMRDARKRAAESLFMVLSRIDNTVRVHANETTHGESVMRVCLDADKCIWIDTRTLGRLVMVEIVCMHDEIRFDLTGPYAKHITEILL